MGMFSILQMLSDAQVDYVLVGGLAVTMRGYQRVTMDVDVALAMTPSNVERFIRAAGQAGLRPVLPVPIDALADPQVLNRWHTEKGMLAFALRATDVQSTVIDVLIRPVVPFEDLRRNADVLPIGNLRVPTASIDDLIRLKSDTGRSKDAVDVEELRKIQNRERHGT